MDVYRSVVNHICVVMVGWFSLPCWILAEDGGPRTENTSAQGKEKRVFLLLLTVEGLPKFQCVCVDINCLLRL